MNDITNLLSRTEKRNSEIISIEDNSFNSIRDFIKKFEEEIMTRKGDDEIVRIVVVNDIIIKLQTKDNGTPLIFDFRKLFEGKFNHYIEMDFFVRYICNEYNLILTQYTL